MLQPLAPLLKAVRKARYAIIDFHTKVHAMSGMDFCMSEESYPCLNITDQSFLPGGIR